jgi:hypothetical protein
LQLSVSLSLLLFIYFNFIVRLSHLYFFLIRFWWSNYSFWWYVFNLKKEHTIYKPIILKHCITSLGDSASIQRNRQYTNAIAILDTKTWTWTIPTYSGIPPSRRSYASGGLLDGKTLTVAFGK